LGLSSRISAPGQEPSSTFFKDKVVLQDQALQLLAGAKAKGIPVKMVLVRIDRYAEIQAKFGETASQEILKNFGDLLTRSAGKNGMITPFTDGQFIILLPEVELAESQKIAENLRKLVEKQRFTTKQGILHLTASFAISDIDTTENSFNRMIDATKKSLEQSSALSNRILFIDKKE
jgi:diguanylate cyclase (GGDEF)-like protein